MKMKVTRRAVTAGLGAVLGLHAVPSTSWESASEPMQRAIAEFRTAVNHFLRVRFETFYEGAPARRAFEMREWVALQPWDQAIARLRRAAQAVVWIEPSGPHDVRCKFEVAETFFGVNALPDAEWSYTYGDMWIGVIEAEASRSGLSVDHAWMRRVASFFEKPDAEFQAVLGRIAGRIG